VFNDWQHWVRRYVPQVGLSFLEPARHINTLRSYTMHPRHDQNLRLFGVKAVSRIDHPNRWDILLRHAADDSYALTRALALRQLADLHQHKGFPRPRVLAVAHKLLKDKFSEVRIGAIKALSKLNDSSESQLLAKALEDPCERVQVSAASLLYQKLPAPPPLNAKSNGDKTPKSHITALSHLQKLLKSQSPDVRCQSLKALYSKPIDLNAAKDALSQALKDQDRFIRLCAIRTLRTAYQQPQISPEAQKILRELLIESHRHADPTVAIRAAFALLK
jgi:HEAT repeat protein